MTNLIPQFPRDALPGASKEETFVIATYCATTAIDLIKSHDRDHNGKVTLEEFIDKSAANQSNPEITSTVVAGKVVHRETVLRDPERLKSDPAFVAKATQSFLEFREMFKGDSADKTIAVKDVASQLVRDLEEKYPKEFSTIREKISAHQDVKSFDPEQLLHAMQKQCHDTYPVRQNPPTR